MRDFGERKAIELIREILGHTDVDLTNKKDDCAVIDFGNEFLLITTDMISKPTHIPEKAAPWQIGWHIVAINLSDIAAMGGEPLGIVVALGLPADCDVEFLKGIAEGMSSCASDFEVPILGGDTKEVDCLTLAGCAYGKVAKSEIMLRHGAKPGNIVAVTGELGRAAAGYHALKKDIEEENATRNLLEIHPRVKEGRALAKTKAVTSCMDISDGLASSIHQMSTQNDLAFLIDFNKIPISSEAKTISSELGIPLSELVIYFGGDYELIVTLDKDRLAESKKAADEVGTKLTVIGEVVKDKRNTLIKDGVSTSLEGRGYEHFRWEI
ncbi:MAG: thiamine-phosphate kinase [Methanomassiliicoccales archaeon]|nr:MAG: thiamine-phosphate kinase [Methanomassiliicoccales archaeon]